MYKKSMKNFLRKSSFATFFLHPHSICLHLFNICLKSKLFSIIKIELDIRFKKNTFTLYKGVRSSRKIKRRNTLKVKMRKSYKWDRSEVMFEGSESKFLGLTISLQSLELRRRLIKNSNFETLALLLTNLHNCDFNYKTIQISCHLDQTIKRS